MKDFFTPEDFRVHNVLEGPASCVAANIANEKLNKMIESMPVVYGNWKNGGIPAYWGPSEGNKFKDTHKARLAFIEELPKEPCKHEPELYRVGKSYAWKEDSICKHCGAELQATWSEKK